jgi:hypothetical protein
VQIAAGSLAPWKIAELSLLLLEMPCNSLLVAEPRQQSCRFQQKEKCQAWFLAAFLLERNSVRFEAESVWSEINDCFAKAILTLK